jgi:DNA-binding winged helix-turn-helix (wHTH) protein
MQTAPESPVRFGEFEVDLESGEMRRNGLKIAIQDQPFRLLVLLLEKHGKVLTREELRQKLWPADTFVEFDRSLNTAINKIREALGDSATSPAYIETVPRKGYRFIAFVEPETVDFEAARQAEVVTSTRGLRIALPSSFWKIAGGVILAVAMAALLGRTLRRSPPPDVPLRKFAFTSDEPVESGLAAFGRPAISPDGRRVAYFAGRGPDRKLWVWRLDRDEHRSYGETNTGAEGLLNYGYPFWSPDNRFIGFSTVSGVKRIEVETGAISTVCSQPGYSQGATWSPDGNFILFASGAYTHLLYEVPSRGGIPKLVPPDESESAQSFSTPFVSFLGRSSSAFLGWSHQPQNQAAKSGEWQPDGRCCRHRGGVFTNWPSHLSGFACEERHPGGTVFADQQEHFRGTLSDRGTRLVPQRFA